MEIILLKDVEKVGLRGEVVNVTRGYARNFLLPRKLAEVATPGRVAEVKRIEAGRALQEARTVEHASKIAETLGKTVLRFDVKAGPTGSLFGSVTPTDIADEIWRTRKIRVDRRKIGVDTIKRIGRYTVPVEVFDNVTAELKLLVVPEGGELPPEEELAAMEAADAAAAAAAAEAAAPATGPTYEEAFEDEAVVPEVVADAPEEEAVAPEVVDDVSDAEAVSSEAVDDAPQAEATTLDLGEEPTAAEDVEEPAEQA
jgi:large subunit ribosomal protein L9